MKPQKLEIGHLWVEMFPWWMNQRRCHVWNESYIELRTWNQVTLWNLVIAFITTRIIASFDFTSAVQYMFHFMEQFSNDCRLVTRASFSTNETQSQNQSRHVRVIFPALLARYRYLLRIVIGSSHCQLPFWLVGVIALFLVFWQSFENRSISFRPFMSFIWKFSLNPESHPSQRRIYATMKWTETMPSYWPTNSGKFCIKQADKG